MEKCNHKRIKENFPFGKKSTSIKFCKRCGIVITNKMIKDNKNGRKLLK
jgi:5'(3')-deoxyribonucleotidase